MYTAGKCMNHPQLNKIKDFIETNNKSQHWIHENLIYLCRSGSHLYGTAHEGSDEDFVGVTIPPEEYWLTLENFEQFQMGETTIYGLKKFLSLILVGSPNISEHLFTYNNPNVIIKTDAWTHIIWHIKELLSKKVFYTFSGYSKSQKHKVLNRQSEKPSRQEIKNQYSYDTKFAAHAIRVMRQGIEILRDHYIEYPRKDAQELLDIRFGRKYSSIEEFMADWDQLDAQIKEEFEKSTLQESPNRVLVNKLLIELFRDYVWKQ